MDELERVIIKDTGDNGYFKDVVARQDINEIKVVVEDLIGTREVTVGEVKNIYNDLYKEIFE